MKYNFIGLDLWMQKAFEANLFCPQIFWTNSLNIYFYHISNWPKYVSMLSPHFRPIIIRISFFTDGINLDIFSQYLFESDLFLYPSPKNIVQSNFLLKESSVISSLNLYVYSPNSYCYKSLSFIWSRILIGYQSFNSISFIHLRMKRYYCYCSKSSTTIAICCFFGLHWVNLSSTELISSEAALSYSKGKEWGRDLAHLLGCSTLTCI